MVFWSRWESIRNPELTIGLEARFFWARRATSWSTVSGESKAGFFCTSEKMSRVLSLLSFSIFIWGTEASDLLSLLVSSSLLVIRSPAMSWVMVCCWIRLSTWAFSLFFSYSNFAFSSFSLSSFASRTFRSSSAITRGWSHLFSMKRTDPTMSPMWLKGTSSAGANSEWSFFF